MCAVAQQWLIGYASTPQEMRQLVRLCNECHENFEPPINLRAYLAAADTPCQTEGAHWRPNLGKISKNLRNLQELEISPRIGEMTKNQRFL